MKSSAGYVCAPPRAPDVPDSNPVLLTALNSIFITVEVTLKSPCRFGTAIRSIPPQRSPQRQRDVIEQLRAAAGIAQRGWPLMLIRHPIQFRSFVANYVKYCLIVIAAYNGLAHPFARLAPQYRLAQAQ